MNKKKNYIELEEVDTGLQTPAFDLKTIRESRGFTLRDMSSSTRVSLSNLEAIEEQILACFQIRYMPGLLSARTLTPLILTAKRYFHSITNILKVWSRVKTRMNC